MITKYKQNEVNNVIVELDIILSATDDKSILENNVCEYRLALRNVQEVNLANHDLT